MDINQVIAKEVNIKKWQMDKARELIEEGCTLPFIARYRKEQTGALNETELRDLSDKLNYYIRLEERKAEILRSIDNQGKLTEDLKKQIENSLKLSELEDLYLPYKKKKKTRGDIAIEKGLQDAADYLKGAIVRNDNFFTQFIDEEKELLSTDDVLKGASDIIAQEVAENPKIRQLLRHLIIEEGYLISKKTKNEDKNFVYKDYYDYHEQLKTVKPHHSLALNRGSKQKLLKLAIDFDQSPLDRIVSELSIEKESPYFYELETSVEDALKRLLMPSLFNEVFSELLEQAELRAVDVFSENLRNLLLQKPIKKQRILGIDPGFRTGCKIVAIDEYGSIINHCVIFPTPPAEKVKEAEDVLLNYIKEYQLQLIVIGNGTASRETQQFIAELIKKYNLEIKYAVVSEAGASVYSASEISVEELPDYDVTTRGAISIARRVQDPLAELVKIPPESIGVGMYQHDITGSLLKKTLEREVESVVNHIGVNLNTASKYILKYISGLNSKTAENIIEFRTVNGPFKSRKDLLSVSGLGPKAFEQAAGFCRIPDSENPFDRTTIHPEQYDLAKELLNSLNCSFETAKDKISISNLDLPELCKRLNCSDVLIKDILESMLNANSDPRDSMPQIEMKDDILSIDDLKEGMILQGTVTNVVDFGAFIDIGIKNSCLLHKSQISNGFVKNPSEYVKAGEIIKVKILNIDLDRNRVSLSMKEIE